MEREIVELRKMIANNNAAAAATATATASAQYMPHHQQAPSPMAQGSPPVPIAYGTSPQGVNQTPANMTAAEEYMRPHEAVASLLDLRSGLDSSHFLRSPNGPFLISKRIEDVSISPERVTELFSRSVFLLFQTSFLWLTRLPWQVFHVLSSLPPLLR